MRILFFSTVYFLRRDACQADSYWLNQPSADRRGSGTDSPSHVYFHVIPRDGTGESVGESGMADAERKSLVL